MKRFLKQSMSGIFAGLFLLSSQSGLINQKVFAGKTAQSEPERVEKYEFKGDDGRCYILDVNEKPRGGNECAVYPCICNEDGKRYMLKVLRRNVFDADGDISKILKKVRKDCKPRPECIKTDWSDYRQERLIEVPQTPVRGRGDSVVGFPSLCGQCGSPLVLFSPRCVKSDASEQAPQSPNKRSRYSGSEQVSETPVKNGPALRRDLFDAEDSDSAVKKAPSLGKDWYMEDSDSEESDSDVDFDVLHGQCSEQVSKTSEKKEPSLRKNWVMKDINIEERELYSQKKPKEKRPTASRASSSQDEVKHSPVPSEKDPELISESGSDQDFSSTDSDTPKADLILVDDSKDKDDKPRADVGVFEESKKVSPLDFERKGLVCPVFSERGVLCSSEAEDRLAKYHIPHLVEVVSFHPHIEREYGPNLAELIRRPEDQVIIWVRDLLEVLIALNSLGLCHRDIKPENIFLDETGHAVLGDLGTVCEFARCIDSRVGTAGYMAPEVWEKSQCNITFCDRGDIFSLGITVLELLTDFQAAPDGQKSASVYATRNKDTIIAEIMGDRYHMHGGRCLSQEWKDFLKRCLQPHSIGRLTAKNAKVLFDELFPERL